MKTIALAMVFVSETSLADECQAAPVEIRLT